MRLTKIAEELEEGCRQMEDVSSNSTASETSAVKDICSKSRSVRHDRSVAEFFVSHCSSRDKD